MSKEALDALRARVHGDPELARRLRAIPAGEFTESLPRIAAELGYDVTQDDVTEAIAQAKRSWTLRWIQ